MIDQIPLELVLIVAAALFCIGLFGALARRNHIGSLIGITLMINAVMVNLVAFWRYLEPRFTSGPSFMVFISLVLAAELALGLATIIAVYQNWRSPHPLSEKAEAARID